MHVAITTSRRTSKAGVEVTYPFRPETPHLPPGREGQARRLSNCFQCPRPANSAHGPHRPTHPKPQKVAKEPEAKNARNPDNPGFLAFCLTQLQIGSNSIALDLGALSARRIDHTFGAWPGSPASWREPAPRHLLVTPHHVHTKALQALIIFALASSLILAGCGGVSTGSSDDSMLDILVLTPLSGPAAALGQTGKDAFTAAAKVVNKEGGILGREVKLTFKDDRFDPVTAQQPLRSRSTPTTRQTCSSPVRPAG